MISGMISSITRIGVLAGLLLLSGSASAAAFANQDFSASGVGTGNANVAGITDASAASYNPAAAAWQEGFQLQGDVMNKSRNLSVRQGTAVIPEFGGASDARSVHMLWMPHSSNFGMTAAFGSPFLSNSRWHSALPGLSSFSMKGRRLSVDLVYAVSSTLAVSHGVDWYWFKASMNQGASQFSGEDKASFGAHVGVNWKFSPLWRAGLLLRTGTKAKLKGNLNQLLSIDAPDEVKLGVSHDFADAVRYELDVDWARWSRLKSLNVTSNGAVVQGNAVDLNDTFAIKQGLTWFWRPQTTFRFGYGYETAANKKSAYQPIIADQPGHRLSLGAGGQVLDVHLDLAYAYTFRTKTQATGTYAGIYRDRDQTFALSVSYKF